MAIYTRKGDKGKTSILVGEKISKADSRIEAIGTVDELNACLGVAVAKLGKRKWQNDTREKLLKVQRELFLLGSNLAGFPMENRELFCLEKAAEMEGEIDLMDGFLPLLKNFILPGGDKVAAQIHLGRTVCRRAERKLVELGEEELVPYFNRLSDYLFELARWVNFKSETKEEIWKGGGG